jgi:hypothetical protein
VQRLAPVLVLAFLVVGGTVALLIPIMLYVLQLHTSGWTWQWVAMFGSMLASTDAVAIISTMKTSNPIVFSSSNVVKQHLEACQQVAGRWDIVIYNPAVNKTQSVLPSIGFSWPPIPPENKSLHPFRPQDVLPNINSRKVVFACLQS